MFKQEKKIIDPQIDINSPVTVIAKNVVVTGDLFADGDVVIDGSLKGSLKTSGSVNIGSNAVIEADIEARTAVIAGKVIGKIKINEFLDLQSTASINGDVSTGQLAVSQGANMNGVISMTHKQSEIDLENEPAITRKNR